MGGTVDCAKLSVYSLTVPVHPTVQAREQVHPPEVQKPVQLVVVTTPVPPSQVERRHARLAMAAQVSSAPMQSLQQAGGWRDLLSGAG